MTGVRWTFGSLRVVQSGYRHAPGAMTAAARRGLSPVGSTVTSRTRSDAYCQFTETPAVADAVSQVVAAVVAENERVRRS